MYLKLVEIRQIAELLTRNYQDAAAEYQRKRKTAVLCAANLRLTRSILTGPPQKSVTSTTEPFIACVSLCPGILWGRGPALRSCPVLIAGMIGRN